MFSLVTGGAGFIGSNIAEELIKRGEKVRVFDNFSTGKRKNIEPFINRIELIEGDLRDFTTVRAAVEGIDVIFHEAALPSVPRSIEDPITTNEVNVGGTVNVLKAGVDAGVKRVVFASSSSVYGDSITLPKHEDMTPNPLSPYAVSKLTGEYYCSVFSRMYGLETIILRYFNVFGSRQDPASQYAAVIPKFIHAIIREERPMIYGDGEQSRDFTYIANIVYANLLAATANYEHSLVLNCACGSNTTLNELVRHINILFDQNILPVHVPERSGDVKHSLASIDLARSAIGYGPIVDFDEGLKRTISFYCKKEKDPLNAD